MVQFNQLTLENFKRYAGSHSIPLSRNSGSLTVVAAQNGVGKTTTLDSIHIALHGKRGFRFRYPKLRFEDWLMNAHSVDCESKEERWITFALDLACEINGEVHIERTYWLPDHSSGDIFEEFGVTINGKPIEIEEGERRTDVSERWIEAFLPLSVMRRFMIDGERLSDFDPRSVDKDMASGIDDLIGIGTIDRLQRHLDSIRKQILSEMVPENEREALNQLIQLEESHKLTLIQNEDDKSVINTRIQDLKSRIETLNEELRLQSQELGNTDNELQIKYARLNSEVSSSRMILKGFTESSLPFLLAGIPSNLNEWKFDQVRAALRSRGLAEEKMEFIEKVIEIVKPGDLTKDFMEVADQLAYSTVADYVDSPLSEMAGHQLEELGTRIAEINPNLSRDSFFDALAHARNRLTDFNKVGAELRSAARGREIEKTAAEMKRLSMELGGLQADSVRINTEIEFLNEGISNVQSQIEEIRSRTEGDSKLRAKEEIVHQVVQALELIKKRSRSELAEPLARFFQDGFNLLSRKSNRVKRVEINPSTYEVIMEVQGFPGNWLDRDLSATERQHVGLALTYALRKLSNRAFPVVVDTPVSRMDRKHKEWSVQRFYPDLSQQVIILATSDDLADGLYQDLSKSGQIGLGLEIREISDNSIEVSEQNLTAFFGGD